jgi:hypothetical protein
MLTLATLLSVPVSGAAQVNNPQSDICVDLDMKSADILKNLNEKSSKSLIIKEQEQQKTKLARIETSDFIKSLRDSKKTDLTQSLDLLIEKQPDQDRKQVYTAFKQTVLEAVNERRAAFDEAISIFHIESDVVRQTYFSSRDNLIDNFKTSVSSAMTEIKTKCDNDSQTDKAELVKLLHDTKMGFISKLDNSGKLTESLKPIIDKRNNSFETARAIFEQSMLDAKKLLPVN